MEKEILERLDRIEEKLDQLKHWHDDEFSDESKMKPLLINIGANLLAGTIDVPVLIDLSNKPKSRNY